MSSLDRGADEGLVHGDSPWRTWSLAIWNKRLLDHFFMRRPGQEEPIVVLLVTAEGLACAAGAPSGGADEVLDAFVGCMRQAIRREGDFTDAAADYPDWPRPPRPEVVPHFVAHLIFACVAAAESDDELADEGSFIVRLRKLTDNQLPEASLSKLPVLWANLAVWLESQRRTYRPLVLPDPGGFTRIGYTVKLTFPDRRDQAVLSRLLHQHGLGRGEPPLRIVLQLVGDHRTEFGVRFLAAFGEFRRELAEDPKSPKLREHRFWAAVRAAALRGRSTAPELELGVRTQLLAVEEDERLMLYIAADGPIERDARMVSARLHHSVGEWAYAVLLGPEIVLDASRLRDAVCALLAGSASVSPLSALVEQGVLPFVDDIDGLALATGDEIERASVTLVRNELAHPLVALFESPSARIRASDYPGWSEVRDVPMRRLSSDALALTPLAHCWQLHEVVAAKHVRLLGGIRVDDGRLGYREVLPTISAPGARAVTLSRDGAADEVLPQNADGTWRLVARDHEGRSELVVDWGSATTTRKELIFYEMPAGDRYRLPPDRTSWMVEGLDRTDVLGAETWLSNVNAGENAERLCEHLSFLGPVVGQFLKDPEGAAWRIVRFADHYICSPVRIDLCVPPTAQVADPGARRRWRKMLRRARSPDQEVEAVRRAADRQACLPVSAADLLASPAAPPEPPSEHPSVERLVAILAGLATNRAGIPWREWCDLVARVLEPPSEHAPSVSRAWEDAGCIDVASYARWRNLAVFPRSPMLVAVDVGGAVRATLVGLTLASTRSEVERAAASEGILVEPRRSFCPLVPTTIALRAPNEARLTGMARRAGVELRWLASFLAPEAGMIVQSSQPAPVGYEWTAPWTRSASPGVLLPRDALVVRSTRLDCPDYWTVTRGDASVWTYHPNLARCWAATLASESPIDVVGELELRAKHSYLPLPLARLATVLGYALPGPDPAFRWAYRYVFVSESMRSYVLNAVRSAFAVASAEGPTETG